MSDLNPTATEVIYSFSPQPPTRFDVQNGSIKIFHYNPDANKFKKIRELLQDIAIPANRYAWFVIGSVCFVLDLRREDVESAEEIEESRVEEVI